MQAFIETDGEIKNKTASSLLSRNITVEGRRTSIRLEPEMWSALKEISVRERCTIHDICTLVSLRKNKNTSLTAAIRVFLMLYFRAACSEEGHNRVGHGNFGTMKARAKIPGDAHEYFKTRSYKKGDGFLKSGSSFDSQSAVDEFQKRGAG